MSSKSKDYCLGIDFGTSNSCASIYINSSVTAVPNSIGERATPSIVSFSDKIYVGEETLDQKIEGKNIISEVKRFIGLNYDEFIKNDFVKNLNYDVVNKDGKPLIKVLLKEKEEYYSPEQISAYIIKKMVQIAEDFIDEKEVGVKIKKAVISVPVKFNEYQKEAIEYAAKLAGIQTIRTIKEPTAAALAYGLGKGLIKNEEYYKKDFSNVPPLANEEFKKEQNVLVFDLGGGTFDLTLLNLSKNDNDSLNFNIISNQGKTHLGGSDFDNKIVDYCIKTFCDITGYDEKDIRKDKRACKKLSIKCEAAKKLLSISNEADINILDFYNNEYLSVKITIDLFERLCKDLFEEIKKTIMELLDEKKIKPEFIEPKKLVGGATRRLGLKK
jgi:molecular chaperone DnaK (HSP70)